MRRAAVALRSRGRFDAANEAENWISAWGAGYLYDPHGQVEAMGEWIAELERALKVDSLGDRVRIRLQPERAWNLDLPEHATVGISDPSAGAEWELRLGSDVDPEKSRALVLESRAFADRSTAEAAALRLETALLLASVRLQYGFALSDRAPTPVITDAGFKATIPAGMQGFKETLGVTFYKTPPATLFLQIGSFRGSVKVRAGNFVEAVQKALVDVGEVDQRTRTAYELYASSRFENSSRSRFLLPVMSIEAMAQQAERPEVEREFIDTAVVCLQKSTLSSEAKEMLRNALLSLKTKSIASATQTLITGAVSRAAANEFKKMYKLRSRLVHGGESLDPSEINDASNRLEVTVKAILLKRLTTTPPDANSRPG